MKCHNCIRLAAVAAIKKCIKCNLPVTTNISVICEQCSTSTKMCSVCLKKTAFDAITNQNYPFFPKCGSCGKR
jgi:hypothetical protein